MSPAGGSNSRWVAMDDETRRRVLLLRARRATLAGRRAALSRALRD